MKFAVSLAGLILLLNSCTSGTPVVSVARLVFLKGTVTINDRPGLPNQKINPPDLIVTGEKSAVILQIGAGIQISMGSAGRLRLAEISKEADSVVVEQNAGYSFHRILTRKRRYDVRLPVFTASVRGTSFGVRVEEVRNILEVAEGQVAASRADGQGTEVGVPAGRFLVSGSAAEVRADLVQNLPAERMQQLQLLSAVPVLPESALADGSAAAEPQTGTLDVLTEEQPAAEKPKASSGMTLEQLRAKFGRLSTITTKSGKVYVGAFQSKGAFMLIQTTKGPVEVPQSEVASVKPLN